MNKNTSDLKEVDAEVDKGASHADEDASDVKDWRRAPLTRRRAPLVWVMVPLKRRAPLK